MQNFNQRESPMSQNNILAHFFKHTVLYRHTSPGKQKRRKKHSFSGKMTTFFDV